VPETIATVTDVKAEKTRSGNTRFVLRDSDGREYTTFREAIARDALAAEGRRARLTFHEEERRGYTNVYLDGVEALDEPPTEAGIDDREIEEAAWKTAVDAAPWLVGSSPNDAVEPDQLYERLHPFKDRVADDIRERARGHAEMDE
jgi:hypothetical protein